MTVDLDAIEARAEAATEGPWEAEPVFREDERDRPDLEHYWDDHSEWAYNAEPFRIEGPEVVENGEFSALSGPDAKFIAHARSDIPDLVAELRAAREVVEAAQANADTWDEHYHQRPVDRNLVGALAAYRAVVGEA
jgi:hypothetical protein